jgi:hypothetical protein
MDAAGQLVALTDLAAELGIQVRHVPMSDDDDGGAYVRLRGKEILFLNTAAAPERQVAALAKALAGHRELQDRFLPPEIRLLLENSDPDAR